MVNSQHVVLVDEQNNVIGTDEKIHAHNSSTLLHRGVSAFLFNRQKELLVQKRATLKKTWGGYWSNSFCGHPQIHETSEQAVHRHAKFELGINLQEVYFIADYRYKFANNGVVENEICPIYLVISDDIIKINDQEVEEVRFFLWQEFTRHIQQELDDFTPWCKEELIILENSETFKKFMSLNL